MSDTQYMNQDQVWNVIELRWRQFDSANWFANDKQMMMGRGSNNRYMGALFIQTDIHYFKITPLICIDTDS